MFIRLLTVLVIAASLTAAPPCRAEAPRLSSQEKLPPLTVVSIIPAQGEPGISVTLSGTGFTDRTVGFLGSNQLPTRVVSSKLLILDLPDLPPGLYALFLRREDGSTSRPYNFMLQPQKPVVSSLSPDTVYTCASGRERDVIVNGQNFRRGAQVLFDGGGIGTRFISGEELVFNTPQVSGGLHQVQVKNPSEALSGIMALMIDSRPEMGSVSIGSDFVSYYELIITGRNFQQGSILVVDGDRLGTGRGRVGERENVIYVGCSQLIYQRHPYDSTPKEIRLQVVNPNGEESEILSITAP